MLGELQGDGRPVDSAIPPGGILNQTIAGVTDILGEELRLRRRLPEENNLDPGVGRDPSRR